MVVAFLENSVYSPCWYNTHFKVCSMQLIYEGTTETAFQREILCEPRKVHLAEPAVQEHAHARSAPTSSCTSAPALAVTPTTCCFDFLSHFREHSCCHWVITP